MKDIILYLTVYKESASYAPRDKWQISKIFATREEAEQYVKACPALFVYPELLTDIEGAKQKAMRKLSTVEQWMLTEYKAD